VASLIQGFWDAACGWHRDTCHHHHLSRVRTGERERKRKKSERGSTREGCSEEEREETRGMKDISRTGRGAERDSGKRQGGKKTPLSGDETKRGVPYLVGIFRIDLQYSASASR
jgi:hypothetical protein